MAIFSSAFDATAPVEGGNSFDPIPADKYTLRVLECVETQSKAGNDMLKLTLEVADGQYERRRIFDYIVPGNNVGLSRLKNLCLSAGLTTVTDASQLEGCLVRAKIKVEAASGQYDASNKVGDYLPRPNGVQPAPVAAAVPARAASSNDEWAS